jgi:hypothetical protein
VYALNVLSVLLLNVTVEHLYKGLPFAGFIKRLFVGLKMFLKEIGAAPKEVMV